MRRPERIPIVLERMNWNLFLQDLGIFSKKQIKFYTKEIERNLDFIKAIWVLYPNLRLTQVLVNGGYIPNIPGMWYYTEEVDWLVRNRRCKFGEIHWWGVYYSKSGRLLKEVKWILLEDLKLDHIKNILREVVVVSSQYRRYFHRRIRSKK